MNLKTAVGLSIALLILIIAIVSILSLPATVLTVIGASIASIVLAGLIGLLFWLYLMARVRYDIAKINAKAATYKEIKDGFGMVHLLNLKTDIIENLSAFPGTHHNGKWEEPHPAAAAAWFALVGKARADSPVALLPAPQPASEQQLDLLPLLDNAERVLVKGASDAGKTTLLQHIASRSQGVVILDPHNKPGQWPDGTRIIGNGYNFAEVNSFMAWFKAEIEKRYKQRAANDESYPPLTIIIDEFMTIREECEETRQVLSKAIRECRKIKIRLFIGSHSELVKPLGLEGAGDVRDGLLIVRLDIDQLTRQRSATVDYGRGERACYFPPFGNPIQSLQVVPDLVLSPSVHTRETKIITLIQAGATDKEIAQEIFGKSYLSGDNFYKVKTLREQYS